MNSTPTRNRMQAVFEKNCYSPAAGIHALSESIRRSAMNNMKMKGLLIGSLPASALVSITYDYGFFLALGISLPEAPTSLFDHVSSWLYRFPYVAALIAAALAIAVLIHRFMEGVDETARLHRWTRRWGNSTGIVTILLMGMGIIAAGYTDLGKYLSVPSAMAIGLGFVSSSIAHWVMRVPLLRDKYVIELQILRYGAPVLLLAFGTGHFFAHDHLSRPYGSHNIYTVQLSTEEDQRMEIIRVYDEWLLVRGAPEELAWIAKDAVRSTVLFSRGDYRWPWVFPASYFQVSSPFPPIPQFPPGDTHDLEDHKQDRRQYKKSGHDAQRQQRKYSPPMIEDSGAEQVGPVGSGNGNRQLQDGKSRILSPGGIEKRPDSENSLEELSDRPAGDPVQHDPLLFLQGNLSRRTGNGKEDHKPEYNRHPVLLDKLLHVDSLQASAHRQ